MTSNDGAILLILIVDQKLGEIAGLGAILGPDADDLDGLGDDLAAGKRKWRIPGVSMVGAWAITWSPATCVDPRHHFFRVVKSVERDATRPPRRPARRAAGRASSRQNPAITELTTIMVATPSITLITLASAM